MSGGRQVPAAPGDLPAPWTLPGQPLVADVLRRAVERNEVSHAWAFVGPGGVGQELAARWLAAALNCGAFSSPCGNCDVCARSLRGVHPGLAEFAPTGAFHRVDDVRGEWLRAAFRSAVEGGWKVLHILDADRMNEAAANAFLKGLEEPPPATVWILDVTDPEELPDTILSRCRVLRFSAWTPAALDAEAVRLGLNDLGARRLAVRAAMGSPLALRRLCRPGALDDLRAHRSLPGRLRAEGPGVALLAARELDEEVKRSTASLRAEGKAEMEALAERSGGSLPRTVVKQLEDRIARRERDAKVTTLQAALDDLLAWYRDCLLVEAGGDQRQALADDSGSALSADAQALGSAGLLAAADLVLATRENLEFNVGHGLALESLFLSLSTLTRS